ncbi:MAG: hypothetical protein IKR57_05395 [Bacilli bacterium]|nr:hypothetical protein [Bacilli bacterium]
MDNKFNFSDKFREVYDALNKVTPNDKFDEQAAKKLQESFDNRRWLLGLKQYENEMINEVKREFGAKECNGDLDEYLRISHISSLYPDLEHLYVLVFPKYKEAIERGESVNYSSEYDYKLTLEEACVKYLGCTVAEAKEIRLKELDIDTKFDEYLTTLRVNYKGSMGELLGRDETPYKEKYKGGSINESLAEFGKFLNDTTKVNIDQSNEGPSL